MTEQIPPTYCANHPNIETNLRCNRCEKLICSKCAIQTPTGYRCRQCVSGQQKAFDSAIWKDYPLGFGVAGVLSFLGSMIIPSLGFFTILLAPIAGGVIAEAARFVIRKRRSKRLFQVIAAGALIGSLPLLLSDLSWLLISVISGTPDFSPLFSILWKGLYSIAVTTGVYYQVSGLVFKH
jgi:hypothetical protein